jgi:hypothetical protein
MTTPMKLNTSKIRIDNSLLVRDPAEMRRRNRRVAYIIVTILVLMTLFCAAYIKWFGGINKGPMQPYHSYLSTPAATTTL